MSSPRPNTSNLGVNQAFCQIAEHVDAVEASVDLRIDGVANLAALALVDTTGMSTGPQKYVATLLCNFVLNRSSTAAPDGITVIAALNGAGNWIRMNPETDTASRRSTWYVDPVSGNDEATGIDAPHSLRTVTEWFRRTGGVVLVDQTVNVLSNVDAIDWPSSFVIEGTGRVRFVGLLILDETGLVATYTAENPATNTPALLTKAAGDWTAHIGKILYIVEKNAWCIITRDTGGPGHECEIMPPTSYGIPGLTDDWFPFNNVETPVPGNTYRVYSQPRVLLPTFPYSWKVNSSVNVCLFDGFAFDDPTFTQPYIECGGPGIQFRKCWFSRNDGCVAFDGPTNIQACSFGTLINANQHSMSLNGDNTFEQEINCSCAFGNTAGGPRLLFLQSYKGSVGFSGVRGEGCSVELYPHCFLDVYGAISAFRSQTNGIVLRPNSHLETHNSGAYLYGDDNPGYGVVITSGAMVTGVTAAKCKINGTTNQLLVGGSANLLPAIIPSAGAVLPAAKPCTTWVQLFGADFNGIAINHDNGAMITTVP